MVFNRYTYYMILRVLLLSITITAAIYLFMATDYFFAAVFFVLAALYQMYRLASFTETSNRELKRFVEAVRYSDFSQSFNRSKLGSSFGDLSIIFSEVIADFKEERIEKEEQNQYLQTIVKHISVGLITYLEDGRVDLINEAAKKLLALKSLQNIEQLHSVSPELVEAFHSISGNGRKLIRVTIDDSIKQIAMFSSRFILRGKHYFLVSLQDIGGELERERMAKELEIAHRLQLKLLPQQFPVMEGYDIAGFCSPAKEVGGDYFDFIRFDNGRLGITVGDVSGKGTPAAIYMTLIKGSFQSYTSDSESPENLLAKINTVMYNASEPEMFVTMLYGILDPAGNTFTFSRAGHNPLLKYNAAEGSIDWLKPKGIGIGLTDTASFGRLSSAKRTSLQSGDILLLYTDGLIEAMNKDMVEFGAERIESIMKSSHKFTAAEIAEAVRESIFQFTAGQEQHDDITVLVLKRVT